MEAPMTRLALYTLPLTLAVACSRDALTVPTNQQQQPLAGCPFGHAQAGVPVLAGVLGREVFTIDGAGARKVIYTIGQGLAVEMNSVSATLHAGGDHLMVAAQMSVDGRYQQQLSLIGLDGQERWRRGTEQGTSMSVAAVAADGTVALSGAHVPSTGGGVRFSSMLVAKDGVATELAGYRLGGPAGAGWYAADIWSDVSSPIKPGWLRPSDGTFQLVSRTPRADRAEIYQWMGRRYYTVDAGGSLAVVSELPGDVRLISLPEPPTATEATSILRSDDGGWLLVQRYPLEGGQPSGFWRVDLRGETATRLRPTLPEEGHVLGIDSAGRLLLQDGGTLRRAHTGQGDWEDVSRDLGEVYRFSLREWSGTYLVRPEPCAYCEPGPVAPPELVRDARRITVEDIDAVVTARADGSCVVYSNNDPARRVLRAVDMTDGRTSELTGGATSHVDYTDLIWLNGL
jgi:hypothetical protein